MTEPIPPRPQPVVIAGQIAGNVIGVVTGLTGLLAILGTATHWAWALGGAAALATVAAGLGKFMPTITAAGAAAQVTPLSDPRDHQLNKLQVDPDTYGRHAAEVREDIWRRGGEALEVLRRSAEGAKQANDDLQLATDAIHYEPNRTDTQEISRVTDHPTRKLGKRPTDPNRPVLRMGAYLRTDAFTPPSSVDYASKVNGWLLGSNDKFGTCGPTSVANLALLVSTLLADAPVTFTDDEIFDLYRRSGNPNFNPATGAGDGGVDMTVMLSELVKNGIGSGDRNVKAVAFGSIDPHDTVRLWTAATLFGGVLWGADLDVAQQAQTDAGLWDYKPSGTWGGHAILSAPAYSDQPGTIADRTKLVTWAELIAATDTFITRQVSECYVVLFPWHLGDKRIYEALDMQGVADEYQQLTGRPFPAPVAPTPEPPAPTPGPAPAPPQPPVVTPPDTVRQWAERTQRLKDEPKYARTGSADYLAWLAQQ